ncbi:MAG: sugar transferase [Coriobacteriia bacterium]|nr:sugar transferase [Coriobacteriia bacterium]
MSDTESPQFLGRVSRKRAVLRALLVVDAVALLVATLGASWVRFGQLQAGVGFENMDVNVSYWEIALVVTGLWLLMLWREGLYDLERLTWGAGEYSRVLRALGIGVVGFILLTYVLKTPGLSRAWTLIAFGLSVVTVSFGRLLVRTWLRRERLAGRMHRRTLIVGDNAEAERIIERLLASPELGLTPVGDLASERGDELALDYCSELVPCLGYARQVASVIREHEIDTVIVATSAFHHEIVSRIINDLRGIDVSIHVSSGLFEILASRVLVRDIAGVPLMTVASVTLSAGELRTKRVFDLAIAGLGVLIGLPIWLLLMLAIVLDSRGPVFYQQTRVGKDGAEFGMYKFRSMYRDADARLKELAAHNEASGPLFKMKNDPRVTRVGKWMRKFSVDEFPQLLNVLRGEMSLVGPRPPLPRETVQYTDHHWRRMEVPPGMTGLWQVSGRSSLTFDEMIRLDLYYIENWSVGFDLALLMRTVPAVVFSRGAY